MPLFLLILICATSAVPYKPDSDSTVLEKLPGRFFSGNAGQRETTLPKERSEVNPAEIAAEIRTFLQFARESGDPRLLGRAQAIISRVPSATLTPELIVLNATILQRLHFFDEALRELDKALALDPSNAQGWLLKASILQVQGNYPEALSACAELEKIGPLHIALAAKWNISSLNGAAESSYRSFRELLESTRINNPSEKQWILGMIADTAERLGQAEEAESYYKSAIVINHKDQFALGAYFDFLMTEKRAPEALSLLRLAKSESDSALLREALALAELNPESKRLAELERELQERFAAGRQRGDQTHFREEARFSLSILKAPAKALELAVRNWNDQREPGDALLVLESALAANDPKSAQPVLEWMQRTKIEDKRLAHAKTALQQLTHSR